MELPELSPSLLKSLVTVVATLGELVAAVAGPDGDALLPSSPNSLHKALDSFIGHLTATLSHLGVTSPGHHGGVTLGETLAAFGDTPGPTWADVTSAAGAWRASVAALGDGWHQLVTEATKLLEACEAAATKESAAAAAAAERAGDRRDKETKWATNLDSLVAKTKRFPVVTDEEKGAKALEEHEATVAAAAEDAEAARKDAEDAVVAANEAAAATERARRAQAALGPLRASVAACDEAAAAFRRLNRAVGDVAAALEGSANVTEGLVAEVARAERLWEACGRLATRHLVGTLGDIRRLLPRSPGGPGGLGGSGGPGHLSGLGGPHGSGGLGGFSGLGGPGGLHGAGGFSGLSGSGGLHGSGGLGGLGGLHGSGGLGGFSGLGGPHGAGGLGGFSGLGGPHGAGGLGGFSGLGGPHGAGGLGGPHGAGGLGGLGGSGGLGGPSGRMVAERCQKAIEDIPRLLRGQ